MRQRSIWDNSLKLYVYTLGCRVNQCESEAIAQSFKKNGHEILNGYEDADLIVVNTCTVTSKAEQKARRMLRIFSRQCPTVVSGCYTDKELEKIGENIVILPIFKKPQLLKLSDYLANHHADCLLSSLKQFTDMPSFEGMSVFDYDATDFSYHCRSYLKVQDGCDNNCGYCRTHIARGKSVFLAPEVVVQRALEIEKAGYHEIVLSGINLTMYDHEGKGLGGLTEKLLEKLGPDMRIRLSSMEPDHIDERLIETLKDHRMQPYFHIPIQSASDRVIKRANRHYSNAHLERCIEMIRSVKEDPLLACDIITGLPAEEDEDFEKTKNFLIKNGFSLFHVFPFSPRPDTDLYLAKDKAPESIRDHRAQILRELSANQYKAYVKRQIGKQNEVILEEYKNNKWYALTGNYIRVEVQGVPENSFCGDIKKVVLISENKAKCV